MKKAISRLFSVIVAFVVMIVASSTGVENIVSLSTASAENITSITGDINGDNRINAIDMTLLKRLILTGAAYNSQADLDSNKQIDYYDVFLMSEYLLAMISEFPGTNYEDVCSVDRNLVGNSQNELSLTVELANLAEKLGTPEGVYGYISNSIGVEFYPDLRKGAIGTFEQHGGNDIDTSSLLISMLQHLGYKCSYVTGEISLTSAQAINYTGAVDKAAALNIISLRDNSATYNKATDSISFSHVWVKLSDNDTDIFLDPSFKEYEAVDSIFNQYSSDFSSPIEDAAYFRHTMRSNYTSVANMKSGYVVSRKIKQVEYSSLPAGLPYQYTDFNEFDRVPSENRDTVSISFGGNSFESSSAELYNKRITIEYMVSDEEAEWYSISPNNIYGLMSSPFADNVNLCPVIKINGQRKLDGPSASIGNLQNAIVKIHTNGQDYLFTKEMCVGGIYTVALDYQNIADYKTTSSLNALNALNSSITKNNLYADNYFGKVLEYVGYNYFTQLDIATHSIAESTNTYYSHNLSVAFMGYNPEIVRKDILGTVTYTVNQSGDFEVDVIGDTYSCAAKDSSNDNVALFRSSAGMASSYTESSVLKSLFDVDSVSTMEVLKYAEENGIDVYTLYNGSDQVLSDLNVNSNAEAIIAEALSAGYAVIVPQKDITLNNWTGSGYILHDLSSGTSVYMLSRRTSIAGGNTTTGISFDQILAMVSSCLSFVVAAGAFYNIMNAFTAASVLVASPGVGMVIFSLACLALAVVNYMRTINLVMAAYNGDAESQAMLRQERAVNIFNIGLITTSFVLTKYGGTIYNFFKSKIEVSELKPDVVRSTLNNVDDAYTVTHSAERMIGYGVDSYTIAPALEYGDEWVDALEFITRNNQQVVNVLNAATDKEAAVSYLLKYGDEAIEAYLEVGPEGINMLLDNVAKLPNDMTNVWSLHPFIRGKTIEQYLAATEYNTWYYIGNEFNGYYPVIDFHDGNSVVSLKTLDPTSSSYTSEKVFNIIEGYAEKLADFDVYHGTILCDDRILDIRVPTGTKSMIDMSRIQELADDLGITIKIEELL